MGVKLKWFFVFGWILVAGVMYGQSSQDEVFTVVLDPGHGGKDPGTPGTGRYKTTEKDIVLAVAKKVRDLLKDYKDIKVIMTRSTDKFVELRQRADIANKNKADVFVSIHCNASRNPKAKGSETFVLGIHRNKDNLEVAKRENAVILLEEDYQLHYEGFDHNSPETFIGLEIMQEEFLEQSILLASMLQREYEKRVATKNRSVQQAGFAVLRLTYMPSILTEIGFLTNPQEEKMLRSDEGQQKIAVSIANAIVNYKKIIEQNSVMPDELASAPTEEGQNMSEEGRKANSSPAASPDAFYSVQIKISKKKIPVTSSVFKGLRPVFMKKMNGMYKYFYGRTTSYDEVRKLLQRARRKGFKDAFIVGFVDGKRVPVKEVKKLLTAD